MPGQQQHLALLLALLPLSLAFPDWLVTPVTWPTALTELDTAHGTVLRLSNGLITRDFLTAPGLVTFDFYSHEKNSSLLRALDPEAEIRLDGRRYPVGGVVSDTHR